MARALHDIRATSHFDFLYGSFSLSKCKIPYLVTTVSLEDAANDLHVTAELPGAENIRWSIEELYQRDIDWRRVDQRITPYLRDMNNPQFFNSITIALLPYDATKGELVDGFSDGVEWRRPSHDTKVPYGKQLAIGPISLGFWDKWNKPTDAEFRSGRIRWNKDQIFAVAMDGQHRLAAIKKLVETSKMSPEIAQTRVPVILLIFDETLGYENPGGKPTVEILRQLFIDLNKHAQTVGRGRQILLDDRDPHSLCVRALLDEGLSDNLDELSASPPRMPLSLVDWHSEQAKFDDGPYLATVLGLDWLVSQVLETKPIRDFTDYGAVAQQIKKLQHRLGIELADARERLEELESFQLRPFSYSHEDLDFIRDAFADIWSEPLVHIFTKFHPYATLINMRTHGHTRTLSLDHQQWFYLRERKRQDSYEGKASQEYRQFLGRVATRPNDPISETALDAAADSLDGFKSDNLAFNVAFQRALFWGFLEYAKISTSEIAELNSDEEDDDFPDFGDLDLPGDDYTEESDSAEEEFADSENETRWSVLKRQYANRATEFVQAINRVVNVFPGFLEVNGEYTDDAGESDQFWAGTLLRKPEDTIDFTQGASKRARELIFLAAAMALYDDTREPDSVSDFDHFWIKCTQDADLAVTKSIDRALYRFCSGPTSGAGRAIRGRGEEYTEQLGSDEGYARMYFLWRELGL